MSKLHLARKIHLYLGLVFAPSIVFFAFTGAFQLFDLHFGREGNPYQPPAWLAIMAQVHIHQKAILPKPFKNPQAKPAELLAANSQPVEPKPEPHSPFLLKCYFLLLAVGLIITTVLGVYMSFAYLRDPRMIFGLLTLGTIVPVVLLYI